MGLLSNEDPESKLIARGLDLVFRLSKSNQRTTESMKVTKAAQIPLSRIQCSVRARETAIEPNIGNIIRLKTITR